MIIEEIKDSCPVLYKIGLFLAIADCTQLYTAIDNLHDIYVDGKLYTKRMLRKEVNTLISLLSIEKFNH